MSPACTCAEMAAFELYTPQGAEMVSGMIYANWLKVYCMIKGVLYN